MMRSKNCRFFHSHCNMCVKHGSFAQSCFCVSKEEIITTRNSLPANEEITKSLCISCFPSRYLSDVLSRVMHHGSGAEWSVVGAGGWCCRVGCGSCYRSGVMAGQWAAGCGRYPQHPHCPAAGLYAAAAVCQLSGVSIMSYTCTHIGYMTCTAPYDCYYGT